MAAASVTLFGVDRYVRTHMYERESVCVQVNECIFMCVLNCIQFEDVDGEVVSVCVYIYMCVCV